MSSLAPTTLDWVKPNEEGVLRPHGGGVPSPVAMRGRSQWGLAPTRPFEVYEHRFAARIVRFFRDSRVVSLKIDSCSNGLALSEQVVVSSRKMPGQSVYYFEDEHGNRSGRVPVTTANVATTVTWVKFGGQLFRVGPEGGFSFALPLDAGDRVEIIHDLRAPATDPDVVARLLLPGAGGEHDLQRAVLDYLGSLEIELEGERLPLEGGEAVDLLASLSGGFLPAERGAWELSLGAEGLAQELTVEPGFPQEVGVAVTVPPEGGRTSYALSVTEAGADGGEILGSVIELEARESQLRITDGPAWTWEPSLIGALVRGLVDSGSRDPDLSLWVGVLEGDLATVELAVQRGADPNLTIEDLVGGNADVLRRILPEQFAAWESRRGRAG